MSKKQMGLETPNFFEVKFKGRMEIEIDNKEAAIEEFVDIIRNEMTDEELKDLITSVESTGY